ncbi:MAG: amidohydrolase family protein [Chitinophagales bacterium]
MKKIILSLILTLVWCKLIFAQTTFPLNGVYDQRDKTYAFINATIIVDPAKTIQNGVLLIKNGRITETGSGLIIPSDAVQIDLKGSFIYPSFIDLDADYGIPTKQNPSVNPGPQLENKFTTPVNWNQAVTPEFNSYENFASDTSKNRTWRNAGFGATLTHRHDGILSGTGALVLMGNEPGRNMIVIEKVSNHYSFKKGSSTQDYPSSEMGSIALIRQTLYDADWYSKGGNKIEKNISLEAINQNKPLINIFDTKNKLEILRADKIGDEFNFQYIIKGSGDEYQRVNEIKNTGASLIIPVNYPKTPDVSDPFDAELISLGELKHWEMAPANCSNLEHAGIKFAITSSGLEDKNEFLKNVRKAIKNGMSETTALAALTTIPASLINAQNDLGTIEKGKIANFIITSGNVFDDETIIYQNWVNGKQYSVNNKMENDVRGIYKFNISNRVYGLVIKGKPDSPEMGVIKNTDTLKASGTITNENISIQFNDGNDLYRLSGWVKPGSFSGQGQLNDKWVDWSATFTNVYAEKKDEKKPDTISSGSTIFPFTSFGWTEKPKQQEILIVNATVWTNETDGILKNYDVLISQGKILKIGKSISAKNALVIDGTNKHLTAGIIDEHSHIAISDGVNEGTQSSSAEVRIGDVVDCDDVNIYRQLSGGVTTSHLLHGSANAIGGQTQLIKLRWGASPEEMKFQGWPGFIKFALGENVKQANWGDLNRVRFPQTRMGVEQVYEDYFTRAEEYIALKNDKTKITRTDLELEAIAEIIQQKRFITCHSYVQSEINMLMTLAERHHFKVNTFTHILEGYKVADKMKEHGAGAAGFSDWWAYKFEVYEAIPQNATILNAEGVVAAINSDDAEMARRLNQEAAKSIKYGGMNEEDALKLVTLNPAKLLHVDDRVGSIKEGKDADVVLWSDNPLSIYAIAEKTIVDGIIYYDRDKDAAIQQAMTSERIRIISKMLDEKNGGKPVVPIKGEDKKLYDCEDVGDFVKGY